MNVEIPLEDLARLTGKSAVELKSELFDEGEEIKQKEDAVKIIDAAFSKKFATIKDENHGKGLRKAMSGIEEWVKKTRGFTPDGDLQGAELLDAWAASLQKSDDGGKKAKSWKPEDLEADPVAQDWLNLKVKALKEAHEKKVGQLTEQLTTAQQRSLRERIQRETLSVLDSANWIAGEDDDTRKKRVDAMFRLIEYDHIRENENGEIVVVDDTGNQRKDATFNPVGFADYVKNINPFGFHKYDPGKASPSPQPMPQGGKQNPNVKILIRDEAHYNELKTKVINENKNDVNKRVAALAELYEAWKVQRPA